MLPADGYGGTGGMDVSKRESVCVCVSVCLSVFVCVRARACVLDSGFSVQAGLFCCIQTL